MPKYEVIKNDKASCQRSSGAKIQTSASSNAEVKRSNVTTANINAAQLGSKIKNCRYKLDRTEGTEFNI